MTLEHEHFRREHVPHGPNRWYSSDLPVLPVGAANDIREMVVPVSTPRHHFLLVSPDHLRTWMTKPLENLPMD